MGKNGKLPPLTPWDGAEKEECSKAGKKKKLLFKSGALGLPLTHLLFCVELDLFFRLLKTSKKKGLGLFVKLWSHTDVRRYSQLCLRDGIRVCRSVLNVNDGGAGEIMVIKGKAMI